jgi:hypothetical protein
MNSATAASAILPDPAAIFAIAHSLWEACHERAATDPTLNLSEAYNGVDQFMRELMRVAGEFEGWACMHIDFTRIDQSWPYLLKDGFGDACFQVLPPAGLAAFNDKDCLRVALRLGLPVKRETGLPVPADVSAPNPSHASGSMFRAFRIQTVRDSVEDNDCVPYTAFDDPFDSEFGPPYFGLYGVGEDGLLEHIADRRSLGEALTLAKNLVAGVEFA